MKIEIKSTEKGIQTLKQTIGVDLYDMVQK